jgi:hypothetical protein
LIDPSLLRADSFQAFLDDRQEQLLALMELRPARPPTPGLFQRKARTLSLMTTLWKPN